MTSTQVRTAPTRTEGTPRRRRPRPTRTGILLAVAVAALVALTIVVSPWNRGGAPAAPPTSHPPTSVPSAPPAAFLPGGSVYEQQVPDLQHRALEHGPGGTVDRSQVAHAR